MTLNAVYVTLNIPQEAILSNTIYSVSAKKIINDGFSYSENV
jgi:hypothetical protein